MESQPQTNPFQKRLTDYLLGGARADAIAGLTVAVMGVPQAMAYALIADLPPVYGLYTAIISCVVAAVLGSSRHLVTGPTNALCMVTLSLTAHLPKKYGLDETHGLVMIVLLLTFMTGVVQLAFGLLRLGGIIRYVSNSVVVGFTAGAGILIAFNQLENILGIKLPEENTEQFYQVVYATFARLPETNLYALAVGLTTALVVIFAPKLDRRLPGALLGVAVAGLAVWLLGWHDPTMGAHRVEIVRDIEPIRGSLPSFHIPELILSPNYELTRELGAGALALALLGLIEAASIARAVASSSGQRLDFTKEFVGQGAGNIAGAFFFCLPASGSFTRTAVCYQSGGKTRGAAIFSALWTTLALVFLGGVANHIPKPALAGILVVIAYTMVEKHRLKVTWRSGSATRLVLIGTLGSTLVLPLELAIFVGVFLSIVILLRTTGQTDLTQLVPTGDSHFEEVTFNRAAPSPVVTVNMEGDLYFAAAEDLDYELLECITPRTRVVVLRMKRLRAVGSTAMAILDHFHKLLRDRGIYLVVSGIESELTQVMTGSGLRERIGEQNIFYADNRLFQSTELALARAWSIVRTERAASPGETADTVTRRSVVAADLMTTRCIRFGNEHQLREAVWLMSELQKHTGSSSPQPLFLQNKEAVLAGELGPWRLLAALANGTRPSECRDLDDQAIGEMLRRDFTRPIDQIARTDLDRVRSDTSLAKLLETSVRQELQVVPICDPDGRLEGLVSTDDLLRGLLDALVENGRPKERPDTDGRAESGGGADD